ncbi:hypothetical protein, partial [Denitromonas sp.]|uniref:hypothetical protein n=1 Tax=Denitromonas sp. TaxID=2734609 RepID=UPI003A8A583A
MHKQESKSPAGAKPGQRILEARTTVAKRPTGHNPSRRVHSQAFESQDRLMAQLILKAGKDRALL